MGGDVAGDGRPEVDGTPGGTGDSGAGAEPGQEPGPGRIARARESVDQAERRARESFE